MQTSYATQGDHTAEEGAADWTEPIGSWFYLDAVTVRTTARHRRRGRARRLHHGRLAVHERSEPPLARLPRPAAAGTDRTRSRASPTRASPATRSSPTAPGRARSTGWTVTSCPSRASGTVFLFEGVNDIKAHTGVTAEDMIAGYREIIARAHEAGKCVVGATVAPFKGWSEWDAAGESVRQDVNAVHPGQRRVRRRHRLRPHPPQPLRPRAHAPLPSTAATVCTPTTRACRRWPTPSTSRASTAPHEQRAEAKHRGITLTHRPNSPV